MSAGNKSGFEIRADLLIQAQSILDANFRRARDAVYTHNTDHPEDRQPIPVATITSTDVITTARELYEFVNEKS
tara:strand:+ start:334 stop:555 length:222 start_codon:yes stop_codon:yes gene_type:complete